MSPLNSTSCRFLLYISLAAQVSCSVYRDSSIQSPVNQTQNRRNQPATGDELIAAALNGDPSAYLLVNPTNANSEIRQNWRLIHHAAFERDERLVIALIENGADTTVNGCQQYGGVLGTPVVYGKPRSPAYLAAMWGDGKDLSRYICRFSGEDFDSFNNEIERRGKEGRIKAVKDTMEFYQENFGQRADDSEQ